MQPHLPARKPADLRGYKDFEDLRAFDWDAGEPSKRGTYANKQGRYQEQHDALWKMLVPPSGECPIRCGEVFRMLSKLVYDGYNNGFGNVEEGLYTDYINTVYAWARKHWEEMSRDARDFLDYLYDVRNGADSYYGYDDWDQEEEDGTQEEEGMRNGVPTGFWRFIDDDKSKHAGIDQLLDLVVKNTAKRLIALVDASN